LTDKCIGDLSSTEKIELQLPICRRPSPWGCIGLLIGTEFSVAVFINPILHTLDERTQAHAVRLFAQRLGAAMPFWYGASLLLLLIGLILRYAGPGKLPAIAATVIWIAVVVHALLVLVPINNRMTRLDSNEFSPEAQREHNKWDRLHRVRVAALAAAMVCFLVAIPL
jgi:uncharacterized membrane protein